MRTYHRLNLADIYLGLEDLFTKRKDALLSTKAGAGQADLFEAQRQAISELPPTTAGGRAFADELAIVDDEHDGYGYALWFITEAYLRLPGSSLTAVATRVREAFVPEISELQASYADEAAAAGNRKEKLVELEADLRQLPTDGGTAYDWAVAFVTSGEKISALLSQRADVEAQTRKEAQILRSETVGMLNDLRRAIGREKKRNDTLPEDIDAQIFGYFDTLEEHRSQRVRAPKPKAEGDGEG